MRRIIKRLLDKYGYPPEEAKNALKVVMRQAEKICGNIDALKSDIDTVATYLCYMKGLKEGFIRVTRTSC